MADGTPQSPPSEQPAGGAPRPSARPATLGSRPGFWPTAILVAASSLLLFEYLAYQLRSGHDPALGGATASAAPRPVIQRRVVKTRVVEDPAAPSGRVTVSGGGSSSSSTSGTTSTPAPAAPAPAAPLVTSSS